jgi:hypothetical protein
MFPAANAQCMGAIQELFLFFFQGNVNRAAGFYNDGITPIY